MKTCLCGRLMWQEWKKRFWFWNLFWFVDNTLALQTHALRKVLFFFLGLSHTTSIVVFLWKVPHLYQVSLVQARDLWDNQMINMDMNSKQWRKSQPAASLLVSASPQPLMNSSRIVYHVSVIREDSFLYVLSIHVQVILYTHAHTHTANMCDRERRRGESSRKTT